MGPDATVSPFATVFSVAAVASLAGLPGWRSSTLKPLSPKVPATVSRKRSLLTLCLAVLGVAIATAFGVYFGLDPRGESTAASASLILCPGTILFATFIDAEPWTNGFLFMWLAIGVINLGLYGGIGHFIGRLFWRSD